jgi:signal transduction histidine kinase
MTPMNTIARARPVILVIEDDATQRQLAERFLEAVGFCANVAANGEEGVSSARTRKPDLIILDVTMPGIDGFETCRQIRADQALIGTPVLMVSGRIDILSIERAFEAGAADFVAKPVHWPMLAHRIKFLLRLAAIEREMREVRDLAEAGSRAKSAFLASMSHDLRTPLSSIIGFSEIMLRQALGPLGDERYTAYVKDIYDSGVHLLDVVNNVLDLSKVEAGRMELIEDVVLVEPVVRAAVKQVETRAQLGGIKLDIDVDPLVAQVWADKVRLKQILINLLSNAVKFTPRNGEVGMTVRRQANGDIAFVVRDTGIGMTPTDIPSIMMPFQQIDDRLDRRYEGTGLGVPLALAMAKLHGGSLTYDSERGRGTTATLTLPAARLLQSDGDVLSEWESPETRHAIHS